MMKLPSFSLENLSILFGLFFSVGGVVLKLWFKNDLYVGVFVLGLTLLLIGVFNYKGGELLE